MKNQELEKRLGLGKKNNNPELERQRKLEYINLKFASLGFPMSGRSKNSPVIDISEPLIARYRESSELLSNYLSPIDTRIQNFLDNYYAGQSDKITLPNKTFVLDRHGLAKELSLPENQDYYNSSIISSYRVAQGVLHNPKADKRTTKGVFHIAEGGLPVPADKKAVPIQTAAKLFSLACRPPEDLMELPLTSGQDNPIKTWVSLMLRPVVCPDVPGFIEQKSMEVRFFVPGNLVSNLDFVESIFGNAGDPFLTENDSALDVDHWTGHTGCVILATHLKGVRKKDVLLPHISEATERQIKDGMCWENEDELYNDGLPYKLTCRDKNGIMVTMITDNYFGYCKKEVKTQISFSANLYGLAEEEHAGGALVFPRYDLGEEFNYSEMFPVFDHSFKKNLEIFENLMDLQPEGYGIDKEFNDVYYLPARAHFHLHDQTINWDNDGNKVTLRLKPNHTYVLPSGYRVEMIKPREGRRWRLVGTVGEGFFCHKPSTVSGGGKSEISKPLSDAFADGPVFVNDFEKDFDLVESIINREYGNRFKDGSKNKPHGRELLSANRSIGSVIKLLIPSAEYTDEYNEWLGTIPQHVKELVLIVKRLYKQDWGNDWRSRFNVDTIDGHAGKELRYQNQKLISQYLRVGYSSHGFWRTFGMRKDFYPADKISMEDDISASVIVPSENLPGRDPSVERTNNKYVENCEYRFFQRPDDAIIRGYDKQTEIDFSSYGNFFSNYEPLTQEDGVKQVEDVIRFELYTQPLQETITDFVDNPKSTYFCSPANPRLVDGKPTKNPRYLQVRPDITYPRAKYLSDITCRLRRGLGTNEKVLHPVKAILAGRRNNAPDKELGIRPMCCYNPIHYYELPELFMDFVASLTGKSPSTTGAGSEGALTKGPFNAILPVHDLNNALISYLVSDYSAFVTSAGTVGPNNRVDHDISLLVPEVWSRLQPKEQDPKFLIEHGYLEKLEDFEHEGSLVQASRLGYRITKEFIKIFLGRIFNNPDSVFSTNMLAPEGQGMDIYVDSINNVVEAHQRVAELYFEDGAVEFACPPLKILLHIMAKGNYEGKTLADPELRNVFTKEATLSSDWYKERIKTYQTKEISRIEQSIKYLENFIQQKEHKSSAQILQLETKLIGLKAKLEHVSSDKRYAELVGTIGLDPTLVL
jgi:hypothetical protein